ncbi:hypothetical protein F383_20402 [Gossypium arboreum]|uniref:Uncharacterized protein n=1 Tax=Gossypium arboreum TaxID=29729 RepID=A0A0B0MDA5_GOSAR|nr:hypothetical protein F383_20402 [Gossypium arboreum]
MGRYTGVCLDRV